MESLGQLVDSWNRDQRCEAGDDIPRFRAEPIWLSSVEASQFAVAARGWETHQFCFPCRFTDINVIPCRPLPPSDALVTTKGLSSDRIRLVATGAPIPLLKFMLLEQHVRPKTDLKVFMAMLGIAFEKGIQVQRCYDLLFRHCFPNCSDDDVLAMVQKMFEAPTQDELTEQELVQLMREELLAVDPAEAENLK